MSEPGEKDRGPGVGPTEAPPGVGELPTIDSSGGEPAGVERPGPASSVQRQLVDLPTLASDAPPPSPDEAAQLLTAEHPDRYQLRAEVGSGGIGTVVEVFDRHIGRPIALKALRGPGRRASGSGPSTPRSELELRFLAEARITGQLEHPAIVPVYELGQRADGSVYYTMKLVRGRTLAAMIKGRPLAERLALLPRLIDVCNAIAYAHSRGVIHRDLKPENVMLGEFGETVVLDWGLAKARGQADPMGAGAGGRGAVSSPSAAQTLDGAVFGTPGYMSPEQAQGLLDQVDERSDVFSLGAMLYQILAGQPPFVGRSVAEVLDRARQGEIQTPRAVEPDCPAELVDVALRALQVQKRARYPDARALAADVEAFQAGGLVGAHRYGAWTLLRRWVRRHRLALAAVAVVAVAAAGAWFYRGHQEARTRAEAERTRQAAALAEVERILDEVIAGSSQQRWFDIYTFKLISLAEPAVERRLIAALDHPKAVVRRLAARSLGGMKSVRAVEALAARLAEGAEGDLEVLVEVINALGIIGDPRAEAPVRAARWRHGQHGALWKATEAAFRMIPLPSLNDGGVGLSADEWNDRGRALHNKGDLAGALAAYDRAAELEPELLRTYINRGATRMKLGDYRGALADLDRALDLDPREIKALHNRALLKRRMGDHRGALADIDRVVQARRAAKPAQPRDLALALRVRAGLRRAAGELDGAVSDLEQAIALRPNHPTSYSLLGGVWLERGELQRALAQFDRALAIDHDYAFSLVNRAFVYQVRRQPDLKAALSDLDRALELDPKGRSARRQRANVRLIRGDLAGAADDLARSIAAAPEDPWRLADRAVILHAQQDHWGKALTDLEAALKKVRNVEDRLRLALYALAAATRAGARPRQAELQASLATHAERARGWLVALVRRLDATAGDDATPGDDADSAATRLQRCEQQLVDGLRAELAGDRARARRHYAAARQAQRPNNLPCALSLALAH